MYLFYNLKIFNNTKNNDGLAYIIITLSLQENPSAV